MVLMVAAAFVHALLLGGVLCVTSIKTPPSLPVAFYGDFIEYTGLFH